MPDETPESSPVKKKSKLLLVGGAIGGLALVQAGVLFFVFKYMGPSPAPAHGAEGDHALQTDSAADDSAGGGKDSAKGHSAPKGDGHDAKPAAKKDSGHAKKPDSHAAKDDGHGKKDDGHGKKSDAHGEAADGGDGADGDVPAIAEVQLVKSHKVPNNTSGRLYIYDIEISIVVPGNKKAAVEKLAKQRSADIADTISQVMRGADTRMLNETDLRTLRGQMMSGLADLFGDDKLIQKVLIPRCVPLRAD